MLAEATEALSGGAGWVGASLLSGVLGWLLFWHLPAKDKIILDMLKLQAEDRQLDRDARAVAVAEFRATLDALAAHSERQLTKLAETLRESTGKRGAT